MRVLLVEAQAGHANLLRERLHECGHNVVMCADESTEGPCRNLSSRQSCPLADQVDLAVVAKTEDEPDTFREMGAVCAQRHRVPVVRIDPLCPDPAEQVRSAAAAGKDRAEAACAAAVWDALGDLHVTAEASLSPGRVHVMIGVPADVDHRELWRVADRARAAVRAFDPFVAVIDVSLQREPV